MRYGYYRCPRKGGFGYGFMSSSGSYTGYLGGYWRNSYNPWRW